MIVLPPSSLKVWVSPTGRRAIIELPVKVKLSELHYKLLGDLDVEYDLEYALDQSQWMLG
jgi:hypothetical protein